ncbi:unnamed protein product [Vicia faba]|uniref:Uncharacterized protein n=1 Tax=Vicia faba TaxID=3906 RepID=A0AAV1BC15_VICFA|nr:unnamed protein product [Vicia faba]
MEEDRLERGLVGQEWLTVAYESVTPFFTLNSGLHRLNDTSRKKTTGRTRAGVDAREGMGAKAIGIGQRVGRLGNYFEKDSDVRKRDPDPPIAPATTNKLPPDLDPDRMEFKVEEK